MLHRLKYIVGGALVLAALAVTSCKKAYFYSGINDDPTQLHDNTPTLLLPGIEVKSAYLYGGDQSRFAAIFMQQVTGNGNQPANYSRYNVSTDDVDNLWTFGWYGAVMNDEHVMIQLSDSLGARHYAGIARIMMANSLASVTDFWGDAPYSDAFRGLDELQPKFDSQQQIYDTLHALLDHAIADLAADDNTAQPADDDLLFHGDLAKWTRFAHSLKARYYLHTSKIQPATLAKAASEAAQGLKFGENAGIVFEGKAVTSENPWSQMVTQRVGDYSFNGYLNTLTKNAGDPRHDVYFSDDPTTLGSLYGSPNSPVYFVTHDEVLFILSEASLKLGNTLDAANNYNHAVAYNLFRSVGDSSYATTVARTAANITLQQIITQKYIAEFLNSECWTDWRRTGFPAISAFPNNVTNNVIPRSLLYPSGEIRYNSNTKQHTILARLWWDVQ